MKPEHKIYWHRFTLGFMRRIVSVSRWIPLKWLLKFGVFAGIIAFRLSKRYRGVAMRNLDLAYGDSLTYAQKRRITRNVFINFAKSAMEFPVMARRSSEEICQIAELLPEDSKIITELFDRDKGLIVISGHMGNFELMARRFVVEEFRFTVVVRNDNYSETAEEINAIRRESGYKVIGRGGAARPMLKLLRSGEREAVGMLPDQKSDEIFVPFFGVVTGTVAGPAVLALRTGAPILPVFCIRRPDDTHKIVVLEPIEPTVTDDKAADIERIMVQINLRIEEIVRAYPDQWLWLHDRWRVKPPPEVAARWEEAKQRVPSTVC